jgi:hypothetical protein
MGGKGRGRERQTMSEDERRVLEEAEDEEQRQRRPPRPRHGRRSLLSRSLFFLGCLYGPMTDGHIRSVSWTDSLGTQHVARPIPRRRVDEMDGLGWAGLLFSFGWASGRRHGRSDWAAPSYFHCNCSSYLN